MHACMHACIHTYMHRYIHTYIQHHTHTHTLTLTLTHTHTHTHSHTRTRTRTHAHTHRAACMHTYIHTYIHTCVRACVRVVGAGVQPQHRIMERRQGHRHGRYVQQCIRYSCRTRGHSRILDTLALMHYILALGVMVAPKGPRGSPGRALW